MKPWAGGSCISLLWEAECPHLLSSPVLPYHDLNREVNGKKQGSFLVLFVCFLVPSWFLYKNVCLTGGPRIGKAGGWAISQPVSATTKRFNNSPRLVQEQHLSYRDRWGWVFSSGEEAGEQARLQTFHKLISLSSSRPRLNRRWS